LQQLFKYYKGLPHQTAAIQQLETDLAQNGYAAAMRAIAHGLRHGAKTESRPTSPAPSR
jgi:hypothetical protein